jgi:hypothetical protein
MIRRVKINVSPIKGEIERGMGPSSMSIFYETIDSMPRGVIMFKKRFAFLLVLLMVLLPLIAPAAEKAAPTWCNKCNKNISEANKKYSVTLTEGIEPMSFDDIGCSMLWRDGECAMRMSAFDGNARVYDYLTNEPVLIENAFFAYGPPGIKTPRGYGIIAFKTREQAAVVAAQSGKAKVVPDGLRRERTVILQKRRVSFIRHGLDI